MPELLPIGDQKSAFGGSRVDRQAFEMANYFIERDD
jgi:hypothetical protein